MTAGTVTRRAKPWRAARGRGGDVEKRVDRLARSVADIEVALRRAERKIEADARERIQTLRRETNEQLAVLCSHQLKASRLLRLLSTTAERSWDDLQRAADRELTQARTVVDSMLERFRRSSAR